MKYFQEYEKLRKENIDITPGSIWEDYCGHIEITRVTINSVGYKNLDSGEYGRYPLILFKRHFHRVG